MHKLDSASLKCPLVEFKCWLKAIEELYFIDLQVYTDDDCSIIDVVCWLYEVDC